MTDSLPDFTFDPKTGELSRGRAIHLIRLHAVMFDALRHDEPLTANELAAVTKLGGGQ